jgi:hypothetical protein
VEFHNFEFESSRVELQQGLWLPDKVITNNSGPTRDARYPEFEAETVFRDWTPLRPCSTNLILVRYARFPPLKACTHRCGVPA